MALLTRDHLVATKRIHQGVIISMRVDTLRMPDGREFTRDVIEHNGGVVIACQPNPAEIILIRQYRYTVDEELIELPAGRVEIGEPPLVCAQRELIEETGYQAQNWTEIARMYSAPGFCNELLYVYKACDIAFVGKSLDEDEETEVLVLSLKDAWKLVLEGKVRDSKTIAGIGLLLNPANE